MLRVHCVHWPTLSYCSTSLSIKSHVSLPGWGNTDHASILHWLHLNCSAGCLELMEAMLAWQPFIGLKQVDCIRTLLHFVKLQRVDHSSWVCWVVAKASLRLDDHLSSILVNPCTVLLVIEEKNSSTYENANICCALRQAIASPPSSTEIQHKQNVKTPRNVYWHFEKLSGTMGWHFLLAQWTRNQRLVIAVNWPCRLKHVEEGWLTVLKFQRHATTVMRRFKTTISTVSRENEQVLC